MGTKIYGGMMSSPKVTVIDYNMGNVWSVISAFKYLGSEVELVANPEVLSKSRIMVLPGVGSFKKGMEALKERGIDEAIIDAVTFRGARILGVCLGMQLMGSHGTEDGETSGLGLLPNRVDNLGNTRMLVYNFPIPMRSRHSRQSRIGFPRWVLPQTVFLK